MIELLFLIVMWPITLFLIITGIGHAIVAWKEQEYIWFSVFIVLTMILAFTASNTTIQLFV